jgi:hypothetical protein
LVSIEFRTGIDRGRPYQEVDGLLLEKLVTSELEASLKGVTGKGGTETSEESAGTLVGDDLAETTNHTLVVNIWLELDSGLDATLSISIVNSEL